MSDINEAKLHEEAHFHDGAELHDVVLLHDRAELCDVVPLHEVAQFHNEPQPQVKKFTCKRENLTIKGVQYLYNYEEGHKYPALIVSHGFTDNYSGMEVYCEALCMEGYAAFCFSFCGGGSMGEPPEVHSDGDSRDMNISSEVKDLCAVIDYVRSLDHIDRDQIVLMGASQGGFVSGLAAARYQGSVRKLIMLYPALCIPDHARRGCLGGARYDAADVPEEINCAKTVISRKFHEDVCGMDAFLELSKYKGPVLIIHGSRDRIVEYSYSIRARDCYGEGQCALQIFRGMGHGSDEAQRASVIASMRQFLAGRKEVLAFQIVCTHTEVSCQGSEKHSDIYFTGYCDSPHFRGTVMQEGVDHQVSENGIVKSVRAEYTFDGIDGDGERCRLQVVNQWGGRDWKPVITTDSGKLEWLNRADLTAVLEGGCGGLTVRIFMREGPGE